MKLMIFSKMKIFEIFGENFEKKIILFWTKSNTKALKLPIKCGVPSSPGAKGPTQISNSDSPSL